MKLLTFAKSVLLATAAFAATAPALAQSSEAAYPSRPIRLLVGLAPGSAVDLLGRQYAQKLSEILGTPVVVDNRPGAGQIPAVRAMMNAAPDGYTLLVGVGSMLSQGPGIRKDLPYDPLKAMAFVGQIGTAAGMVYANPSAPVNNAQELIAYAKANPGKLSYGSAGVGSAGHLVAEFFMYLTGTKLHHVPFRSDPDSARETAAGTIDLSFILSRSGAPLAESGKLKPLMVIGTQRVQYLPDAGHAGEVGVPGLENLGPYTYYGIVAPAGLPPQIVDKLNHALNQATQSPEIGTALKNAYIDPVTGTPQAFRAFVEKEIAKWHKLGQHVKLEF
jgi:tripartite-type tricarboxylate transporter receptor subunit TctC